MSAVPPDWIEDLSEDDAYTSLVQSSFLWHLSRPCSVITHGELIRELREDSNTYKLREKEIVFIDDFGRGYVDAAQYNIALQFEWFNYRYERRLPTFIASNCTESELRSLDGYEAIIDRIADPSWIKAWLDCRSLET